MSLMGQNAKYSVRADVFRFASELGHCSMRSALRICANSRLMRRDKFRPIDQPVDADEHGSFGQPRFAKTLNHQLRIY